MGYNENYAKADGADLGAQLYTIVGEKFPIKALLSLF
jgi:hypothetical protein